MFFYYQNSKVSIQIDFNICQGLIDDLIFYGCIDDNINIDDVISDAIIDYINDHIDALIDDGDDDIINETNPVYQAICVLSENKHINQYINWKYSN